jgi:hypothetical protein
VSYRNKTYVCFDGDSDIHYYRLMQAWHQSDYLPFSFYDAHDLNTARDTSNELSIKRQLAERLRNTSVFVILIGEKTRYLYRFVRWEIEKALEQNLPIIAVNLNGLRQQDPARVPPLIQSALAVHVSFNAAILQYALENWPAYDHQCRLLRRSGPFYYEPTTYRQLGL